MILQEPQKKGDEASIIGLYNIRAKNNVIKDGQLASIVPRHSGSGSAGINDTAPSFKMQFYLKCM